MARARSVRDVQTRSLTGISSEEAVLAGGGEGAPGPPGGGRRARAGGVWGDGGQEPVQLLIAEGEPQGLRERAERVESERVHGRRIAARARIDKAGYCGRERPTRCRGT